MIDTVTRNTAKDGYTDVIPARWANSSAEKLPQAADGLSIEHLAWIRFGKHDEFGEFGAFIRSETARWSEVARKAELLKN